MIERPIYMDAHATTPVDSRVLAAMMPCFTEAFGNAASRTHAFGWAAARAVDRARQQVADLLGASASEIVFTTGATESNNLAVKGVTARHRDRDIHIITSVAEHRAVLDVCRRLEHERKGCRITYLPVDRDGLTDPCAVEHAITSETVLISVMAANNEIGVLQPIAEIGRIAHAHGVLFHADATQAAGTVGVDVNACSVDLVSLSAHKICGPKGVGALYVRRRGSRVELAPLVDGGGHERGFRPGTLNVPGIVGLGCAAEICRQEMAADSARLESMRNRLSRDLHRALDGVSVNGSMTHRLPNNLNVSFSGVEGEALLMALDDIAVSSGSACTSAAKEPSHVLRAVGVPDALARASVRFGLTRLNTDEEVDYVVDKVAAVIRRLREMSLYADTPGDRAELAGGGWRLE